MKKAQNTTLGFLLKRNLKMGKWLLFIIFLMCATNGFWYCATQQETMGQTPVIVIPILGSIGVVLSVVGFVLRTWDNSC